MVELEADTTPGEKVYQVIVVKESEGPEASSGSRQMFLSGQSYKGTHWQGFDGVPPSGTYRYKAKAQSGSSREADSGWSDSLQVLTPAEPTEPPTPPIALIAKPDGPFRVELKWQRQSNNEYGFEVQKATPNGYVRVGLANPGDTTFVVHGRPPTTASTYRVRAFNPRGISTPTNEATAATPAVTEEKGPADHPVEPCTTRAKAMEAALSEAPDGPDRKPRVERIGGPLELELIADPSLCGNANCSWEVYGSYRGCYRRLGDAFGVGHKLVNAVSGVPILIVIGHMSASDSSAEIQKFVQGRYVTVDAYGHCDGPGEDLIAQSPPFDSCQEDDDLWWPPVTPASR
jgi:hypothetical protein